jgi:hypothetical protein
MIVITGPGRSGTSFLATLYRDLGLDPGGVWNPVARAGFEDRAVVRMNHRLLRELGMAASGRQFRFTPDERIPGRLKSLARRMIPTGTQAAIRSALREPPWRSPDRVDVVRWDVFDDVVERHAPELRKLAAERTVVKDPTFCWTLGVWCAAGVPVEHVLIAVRSLDAMARSRLSQQWLTSRSLGPLKNWMAYGTGLLMSTIHDLRLEHAIVRFPDFLSDPETLYRAMQLPGTISYEAFAEAFRSNVDPDLVHDHR